MDSNRRTVKLCSICNKRFNSFLLDYHLKKIHDGLKYQCGITEMKNILNYANAQNIKDKFFIIDCLKIELKKDYINFANKIKQYKFYFENEILERYKKRLFTELKILNYLIEEENEFEDLEFNSININNYHNERELLLNFIHTERKNKLSAQKICPFCLNVYPSIQQHCFVINKKFSKYSCPKLSYYILKLKSQKEKINMLCKAICFASIKYKDFKSEDLFKKIESLEKEGLLKSPKLDMRNDINDYIIQLKKYFFNVRIGIHMKNKKNNSVNNNNEDIKILNKKTNRLNDINFSISFDLINKINKIFDKYI
jgi:hypothetical protein